MNSIISMAFIFSYTWSLAGNLDESFYDSFDSFVRQQMEDNHEIKVQRPLNPSNAP